MKNVFTIFRLFVCVGILYIAIINTMTLHSENVAIQLLKQTNKNISDVDDDVSRADRDIKNMDHDVQSTDEDIQDLQLSLDK